MKYPHRHYSTRQDGAQQHTFRIEREFSDKIPPIGEAEFQQLRENILAAGEVYEALVVWNGILVDGHNRWKVIQENPQIKYRVREMDFPDKWAAFEWMYKNQLGRRNLTDEQRTYTIGKMYEARKNTKGGDRRSEEFSKSQNATLKNGRTPRMDEMVGEELGVNHATVARSYKFAKGVDAIREVSPEAADKVLNGKANVPKVFVQQIGQMEPDMVDAAADMILNGMRPQNTSRTTKPRQRMSDEDRENIKAIEAIVADMYDPTTTPEFTIDFLIEDIEANANVYVDLLRNTFIDRSNLVTDENKPRIIDAINKVIDDIVKVRESL